MQQGVTVLFLFAKLSLCVADSYVNYFPVPYLQINCLTENSTLESEIQFYPIIQKFEKIYINKCPPSTSSLASMLAEHNISVSSLHKLNLTLVGFKDLAFTELKGLSIDTIHIELPWYWSGSPLNMSALAPLTNLRELSYSGVYSVVLLPMPASLQLVKMGLRDGRSAGEFGGCSHLEELTLDNWDVTSTPDNWLEGCRALHSLTILNSNYDNLKNLLRGATSITYLKINKCELIFPPREFWLLKNLEKLDLSFNEILVFELYYIRKLPYLPLLKEVNLQGNKLENCWEIYSLIRIAPGLIDINVSDNPGLDLCCSQDKLDPKPRYEYLLRVPEHTKIYSELKRLNAARTATSGLCLDDYDLDAIEDINLSYSKITTLKFEELHFLRAQRLLKINVTGNQIQEVSLQEPQYRSLPSGVTVIGVNITVDCDCQNAWLGRALREKRLVLEARCRDNSVLGNVAPEKLECDRYSCDACTCRRLWRDSSTSARCDDQLRALPHVEGLHELWAPNNLVEAIDATALTQSLMLLDLRHNHIARVSPEQAAALFAVRSRAVWLAGNPLVCDCAARPLLLALRSHRAQVKDYEKMTCVNDGRSVSEVSLDDLCTEPASDRAWNIAGPLIGATILIGIFAAGYNRYERKIKEFLFTRGYCLCCVREEQLDEERPYDAFVSFAHLDAEFVSQHLLPELESTRGYRLCVHYRDWAAGGWIPEQISHSVRLSKRVIIVLSKNFLASMWALMEFRLAQAEALEERRARLIVVVLDNVVEDQQVSGEMRGYLAMNTYVKWGDPWFWEKLTFALPRKVNVRGNEIAMVQYS